jgi:hypothetical protein
MAAKGGPGRGACQCVLQRMPVQRQHALPDLARGVSLLQLLVRAGDQHQDERIVLVGFGQRCQRSLRLLLVQRDIAFEVGDGRRFGRKLLRRCHERADLAEDGIGRLALTRGNACLRVQPAKLP